MRVHRTTSGASVLAAILVLCAATQPGRSQTSGKLSDTTASAVKSEGRYQELRRIVLSGEESSGGVAVDGSTQRLYLPRRKHIEVLNESGQFLGAVLDADDVVALTLVPEMRRGFAVTAHNNTLTIFDLKSLGRTTTLSIPGREASNITYDPASRRVFVMNNRSQSIVAVSADQPKVLTTIPLVDDPESAVSDGKGRLYVVLADPAEIAVIDTVKLSLLGRIQLSPCNEPRGIALDQRARRLFVGCSNGLLVVLDPDSRRLVARLPVEEDTGDVALDAVTHVVFTANAAGTISVVSEEFPDKYRVIGTIPTARGASHLAMDPRTHEIFVPLLKPVSVAERQCNKAAGGVIMVIGKR